jgi:Arc/MetJ-type ribon-helix-helix transcriptional regulator
MKAITVRLPERIAAELEEEARKRRISKSDVVRERIARAREPSADPLAGIRDLIGSVTDDSLPPDLSARTKHYVRAAIARKHNR